MTKLALVMRGLAIAAGLLAGAAWLFTQGKLEDMQKQLKSTSQHLNQTRADLSEARDESATLHSALNSSRSDLAASKERASAFQDQYYSSTQEISRLENRLQEQAALLEELQSHNEQLKWEMVTVKPAPIPERDQTREILGYQSRVADLEAEIHELQSQLTSRPVKAAHPGHPADTTGEKWPPPPHAKLSIRATIADLRRDRGLVVLDQGGLAGIRPNLEYHLIKNGTEVGRIRVMALNDNGSVGALISSTGVQTSLNIGDSIWLIQ